MMSLFTPFDVVVYRLAFMSMMAVFAGFFNMSWTSSYFKSTFHYLKHVISNFFYSLKPNFFSKGFSLWLHSTFFSIILFNFLSVWPFIFAPSSQVSVVLAMSLCFWFGMILFIIKNNFGYFMAHSVPEGTPTYLTWFLFLIEMVSNCIRPITLTVRLVANILAGHLLMILLSQLVEKFLFMMPFYMGLNLVELFVAVIQSYIFSTMICLYFSELY